MRPGSGAASPPPAGTWPASASPPLHHPAHGRAGRAGGHHPGGVIGPGSPSVGDDRSPGSGQAGGVAAARNRKGAVMPRAAKSPPRLTDAQLKEVLALTSHADSVELKLTVPDSERRSTVAALGMDPLDAQVRQVFFFDTPDLRLNRQGVVVRARRVQGRGDDTVVKLRPIVPDELPASVRKAKTMVVEVDAMSGGYVCSASFKGALGPGDAVKRVAAGDRAVRKLFSKRQRAFYQAHAPEGLGLDDLTVLGPINVLKLKFTPEGLDRRLVAELWLYPDGERILELSTKCAPGEGLRVAAEGRVFLADRGVDLYGEQHTKTKTALEYFSRTLQEAAAG